MVGHRKSPARRNIYLVIGAAWVLSWVIPWGSLPSIQKGNVLAFLTDMLRLSAALVLLIIPGILLYLLLLPKDEPKINLRGIIPIGFTLSIAIIGVIGLIGRVAGWSFTFVQASFFLVGLIEIIVLAFLPQKLALEKKPLADSVRESLKNPPLLLAVVLAAVMTFNTGLFFIDDASYLAYLTNWQHASQLGFNNLVHEVEVIEHSRFWFGLFPMSQSILADLSGLPGLLLLGSYLEILLVPLAVITLYWFARVLGLTRKAAGFAALIQVALYTWMMGFFLPVGLWFYRNMAEDKVFAAFILAPVFFVFGLDFIQSRGNAKWVLFFLAGVSLFFTHPIILFYASWIMACMGGIAFVLKKISWRRTLLLAVMILGLLVPYLFIRMGSQMENVTNDVNVVETQTLEIFNRVVEIEFHGINPELLKFSDLTIADGLWNSAYQILRYVPIVIAFTAGIIAFANLKRGPLYWYIFTSAFLIVLVLVPYTGWMLGYIVSPRMLSRAGWFSPLGLGGVLILDSALKRIRSRQQVPPADSPRLGKRYSLSFIGMVACLLFTLPIVVSTIIPQIPAYFSNLGYYKQLAQVGAYIDQNTTGPVMTLSLAYQDSEFLPGVSANVRMIAFREQNVNPHSYFMSTPELRARIDATKTLRTLDQTVPDEERCALLERYAIRYIVARPDQVTPFKEVVEPCQSNVTPVFSTADLHLLEILDK